MGKVLTTLGGKLPFQRGAKRLAIHRHQQEILLFRIMTFQCLRQLGAGGEMDKAVGPVVGRC